MYITVEKRAELYIKAAFGGREIFVDPEGHEPGFYHRINPTYGRPYFAKVGYFVSAEEARRYGNGDHPFVVDVTGDSDKILKVFTE